MNGVALIARDELRLMIRNRVAVIAFALLILLTLVASLSSWAHQQGIAELRARHQAEAEQAFDAQPDRHPHRVVHYGSFIFRPLGPLAAFDPGVDAFTGNSMFLEGHRQNSANFGDVRQSSLLVRFGQLTPAFVLQIVAPLLLIFLGYGVLARETERGTLRLLLLQGVSRRQIVLGKLSALGVVAILVGLPAMIGFLQSYIARVKRPPVSRTPAIISGSSSRVCMSARLGSMLSSSPNTFPSLPRSMPAQNALPAPVTTMARTSSSSLARFTASISSFAISTVNAFMRSGRLRVMVRILSVI